MALVFRWLHRLLASVGVLVVLVTVTPVLRWWTAALSAPWGPGRGDALVILGGELYAPDILELSSYWRCLYGALTWRTGQFERVIVSGRDAAPLMADFLVGHGVPAQVITIEGRAESTRENAVFVARLLGPRPGAVVLLTSEYHSARAIRLFRQAGITVTALPYPDANKRLNRWTERWSVM